MSVINPLTASSDIARTETSITPFFKEDSKVKPTLGNFADDILNISTLGFEKQQKEIHIDASNKIDYIANEVIRVSSSIGRAKATGNLTTNQATELYKKISNLL